MPEFLADGQPVATQDFFVDALTLGPAAGVRSISFSVLGANAVTVQCWRYTDPSKTKWILEQFDRVFAGQSIGVVVKNCAGLRFANASAGKSSLIVAELDYESDVDLTGGSITSAAIDSSGNITPPPPVSFNIQHNGVAVGTEPTLDFVDESGGIAWTVVDDSGNTRVQVTPTGSGIVVAFAYHFANVSTTGNNFAGGTDLLSPQPLTFNADGVSDYLLTAAASRWQLNNAGHSAELHINLDGADAGQFAQMTSQIANVGQTLYGEGVMLSPTKGAHTVNARAWADVAGDTLTIVGGAGGVGGNGPIILKVIQL